MRRSPWAWLCPCLISLLAGNCQERLFNNPHDPNADAGSYELLATLDLPGIVPVDLAYSGDALWVSDSAGRVLALNANSGQVVRELDAGEPAAGIAYDGLYLWMSVRDTPNLQQLSIVTAQLIRDLRLTRGSIGGLDWADRYLYAADRQSNSVLVLNDNDGSIVRTVAHPGFSLDGVAYDGSDLWTVDSQQATLYRIAPSGAVLAYPAPDRSPAGLCAVAGYIWLGDRSGRVYKLRFR